MKKKMIIITCLVLFYGPMVWAQEKVEAPVWNVGDKWTYKRADGATFTNEVVDVKEDVYVLKSGEIRVAYDRKTLNQKYIIEKDGREVESESSLRKLFDFPIFLGKKWFDITYAYPSADTRRVSGKSVYNNDFKVEGIEDVVTEAGTFKAYKIRFDQFNRRTMSSGWIRFWYSPEAKTWVKRAPEKSRFWRGSRLAKDVELVSYELK